MRDPPVRDNGSVAGSDDYVELLLDGITTLSEISGTDDLCRYAAGQLKAIAGHEAAVLIGLCRDSGDLEMRAAAGLDGSGLFAGSQEVDRPLFMSRHILENSADHMPRRFEGGWRELFSGPVPVDFSGFFRAENLPPAIYTLPLASRSHTLGTVIILLWKDFPVRTQRALAVMSRQAAVALRQVCLEESRKNIEALHNVIIEGILDCVMIIGFDGTLFFANRAARSMFGFDGERSPVVERFSRETIHAIERDLALVCRDRGGYLTNYKGYGKDGREVWMEALGTLIFYRGIPAVLAVIRDISSRVETERKLNEARERYSSILEEINEAYYEVDSAGTFIFVNNVACRMMNLAREELIGRNYRECLPPATAQRAFKAFSNVFKDGHTADFTADNVVVSEAGPPRTLEIKASLMRHSSGAHAGFRGLVRDITERVRADEEIRKNEERYRTILESIDEGYFEVDLEGKPTFCTELVPRMQYVTREEFFNMTFRDYTTRESADIIYREFLDLYKTGIPRTFRDYEVIAKDGSHMIHELSASLMRDSLGNPIGFRGIVRDVTERKRTERALVESEERYRTILENINEGYYETDLGGRHTFCNDAVLKMHGVTREQFYAMNYRNFMTKESAEKAYRTFSKVLRTGIPSVTGDYDIIGGNGDLWVHEYSVSLMPDSAGNPVGFRGVVRDVTEQRRAEREIRENEERYRSILENTGTAVVLVENNTIAFANAEFEKLSGFSRQEIEGKKNWFDFVIQDDMERLQKEVDRYLANISSEIIYTAIGFVTRSGEVRHVHANISWITGTSSTLISLSDMTNYKKLENRFIEAQRLESIGTLAGGIAHNFNNLLMGIQGNASLMIMGMERNDPFYSKLRRIEEHVKAGADLTSHLLGFARGGKYEVVPTDMTGLIEKIADMFESTRKDVTIRRNFEKNLWITDIDRGQIEQVILNVLVNAWQAMPGGGDITIGTSNVTRGDDRIATAGNYVQLSVKDSGIGMDDTTKERIFEPFFTTKATGQASGLGLASAYGIVKNHGGFITVESEQGRGTTFHILLPAGSQRAAEDRPPSRHDLRRGTETVLLVDDEKMLLDVGKEILEALGYNVLTAGNDLEALEALSRDQGEIHLAIIDMVMPGMSGGALFDRIREIRPTVKMLLASGHSLEGEAQDIMDRGCDGFIQKPFDIHGLSRTLQGILDSR